MIQIPARPILDYIDRLGGVSELPGITGMRVRIEGNSPGFGKRTSESIVRDDDEQRQFDRVGKAVERMKQRLCVDLFVADAFCCEVLKVHPHELYQDWHGYEDYPVDLEHIESLVTGGAIATRTEMHSHLTKVCGVAPHVAYRVLGDLDPAVTALLDNAGHGLLVGAGAAA